MALWQEIDDKDRDMINRTANLVEVIIQDLDALMGWQVPTVAVALIRERLHQPGEALSALQKRLADPITMCNRHRPGTAMHESWDSEPVDDDFRVHGVGVFCWCCGALVVDWKTDKEKTRAAMAAKGVVLNDEG